MGKGGLRRGRGKGGGLRSCGRFEKGVVRRGGKGGGLRRVWRGYREHVLILCA